MARNEPAMIKIPLYVSNHKAYVWSVQDVAELRSKHRICGTLSGTLPHLTQQNFFLGLPLLLMPEEVVLLVKNDVAVLVDDTTALREPSPTELAAWDASRKRQVSQQIALLNEREMAREVLETTEGKGKDRMSEEAVQKRKERQERKTREFNSVSTLDGEDLAQNVTLDAQAETQLRPNHIVHIPSTASSYPWYQPLTHEDLHSASLAGLWTYPQTPGEIASCRVFRDLWEKGHFLGSGLKFGGDFLVYPGDPLRYHSHFVASVQSSPASPIRPMEIVAHGRLGTATKKAHLLCSWDEVRQEVTYFSIEWAGFG